MGGFTEARDRIARFRRIRKCRKSPAISDHGGGDSQALPPFSGSDESAGSARLLPLNPPDALVPTHPFVCSPLVSRVPILARFALLAAQAGLLKGARRAFHHEAGTTLLRVGFLHYADPALDSPAGRASDDMSMSRPRAVSGRIRRSLEKIATQPFHSAETFG